MTDRQKTRPRPNPRRAFAPSYGTILEEGVRRRTVLKGFIAAMGAAAFAPALEATKAEAAGSSLTFPELKRVRDTADHWPDGYECQILIRWVTHSSPTARNSMSPSSTARPPSASSATITISRSSCRCPGARRAPIMA